MLPLIPCTLVLFWLRNLNLDNGKETVTFPPELASILKSPQNAFFDSALKRGLEATKAILLGEEKVGEALAEKKVKLKLFCCIAFHTSPTSDTSSFIVAEWLDVSR